MEGESDRVGVEPIAALCISTTLRYRCYEKEWRPITRITHQLGDLNNITRKGLDTGGKKARRCLGLDRAEKGVEESGQRLGNR